MPQFAARLRPAALALLVLVGALAGCGQKGDLFLPEAPEASLAQAAAPART